MIPISLTIKGLFSYQEEQTIHFDRLLEGQLFGIFGAVGSGKSSILEAIAFALYGETERLNMRDDRNYNMMNLKSDELLIDFIFANFDERRYRFIVRGKRHGKKFEKVNTFERAGYLYSEDSWQPLAEATAEPILGLSYENFRRTIIIPQGKFQEFLQLTDKARTDMLKDIFQLDKFEFFYQTVSLEKKNNEILQGLNGQLQTYVEITQEAIDLSKDGLRIKSDQLEALSSELAKKEQLLKELERKKHLFEELQTTENTYKKLEAKAGEYYTIRDQLGNYEYCERYFKADLQRLEELKDGIQKRNESLAEYQHKLKTCETLLMEQQQEFANISLKYQSLEQLNQRKLDYQTGLQLIKLKDDIRLLTDRITKGRDILSKVQKEKIQLEKIEAELNEKLKKKKDSKPNVAKLSEIKSWFMHLKLLQQRADESHSLFNATEQSLQKLDYAREQALAQEGLAQDANYKEVFENRNALLEKQLEEAEHTIGHMKLQAKLGDLVNTLHNGQACPLCGAVEHPQVMILEDVEKQLEALKGNNDELKIQRKALQDLLRRLELMEVERLGFYKNRVAAEEKKLADEKAVQEHFAAFHWNEYSSDNVSAVDEQLAVYELLENEITVLEAEVVANSTRLKKVTTDRDQYEGAIRKIIEEERTKTGSLNLLVEQLKIIPIAEIENGNVNGLKESILSIENECEEIAKRYTILQQALQEQQQLKLTLDTRFRAVTESLVAEHERVVFIQDKIHNTLRKSKFSVLEEVTDLLNLNIAVNEVRENMETFFRQLLNAKEQYIKLQHQTEGEKFKEEEFTGKLDEFRAFKEVVQQEHEDYIAAKNNYERLLRQFEKKQQLELELLKIQRRGDSINTLKNLFKGSGFVSYISSVYLQQLCEAANKRFYKLTRQQLKLEVTDRNEFQVRDYLNDGKTRLAKTLSGGQTFQASLSLALALAESIQQQNKAKQNFFFLDEGFGSLDKESLAVAFDTLKTLRNEHRIVGIISHVEELQQEIDVYLNIKNDPLIGSRVKGNWEQN